MLHFDEIRSFTSDEIARVDAELSRVQSVIAQKQSDLSGIKYNPLNYLIETQRDAMTRMENGIKQDQLVLDQLTSSKDEVLGSNDTDKLSRWFDLSAVVGDAGDLAIWRQQKEFASTSATVSTVAKETAKDITTPFGIDWKWIVGGLAVLWLGSKVLFRRKS